MIFEFGLVKVDSKRLRMRRVRQFSLTRNLRNFPTDKAVDRITGQNNFRAPLIIQTGLQHAWFMIVEEPKARQSVAFLDPFKQ
ncbi:MAG: hypothetical protein ACJAZ1_001153 [Yoonia sp.]